MKFKQLYYASVLVLSMLGSVIACSPTKFTPTVNGATGCTAGCTVSPDGHSQTWTQNYQIGAGKVDILFIDDNSASMASIQTKLAARFGGFVEALDAAQIDYKIAIATTDATKLAAAPLIAMGNGTNFITSADSNRVQLFNAGIVRTETVACEKFIQSAYATYGPSFQTTSYYNSNYSQYCPSGDTRGILAANYVVTNNSSLNFLRSDANLNIITLSNDDERAGQYNNGNSSYALTTEDLPATMSQLMSTSYPNKYWEFNSIITKDQNCALQQEQAFTDSSGNPIKNSSGNYVITAEQGIQYAALSASASKDVDGNAQPRGKILDICQSDYTQNFKDIAANIADSARLLTLNCAPASAPVVVDTANPSTQVPYTWTQGSSQITFQKGSEKLPITVTYTCYKNSVQ